MFSCLLSFFFLLSLPPPFSIKRNIKSIWIEKEVKNLWKSEPWKFHSPEK